MSYCIHFPIDLYDIFSILHCSFQLLPNFIRVRDMTFFTIATKCYSNITIHIFTPSFSFFSYVLRFLLFIRTPSKPIVPMDYSFLYGVRTFFHYYLYIFYFSIYFFIYKIQYLSVHQYKNSEKLDIPGIMDVRIFIFYPYIVRTLRTNHISRAGGFFSSVYSKSSRSIVACFFWRLSLS